MEEDGKMRRLLEQLVPIFYSYFTTNYKSNVVTSDMFVPSSGITKAFFKTLKDLLIVKKYLILKKWEMFFAISCLKALSSHEMYLRYVFFACEYVTGFSDDVFDALLTVFVLVVNYNIETLINTEANFCGLSFDIISLFFENSLKEEFYRLGGFERFDEYLRHEYLEWESYFDDLAENRVHSFTTRAICKLTEKIGMISYQPEFITYDNVMENSKCQSFAKQLLSSTKKTLPTLPSPDQLKSKLRCARKLKVDITEEYKRSGLASTHQMSETDLKRKNTGEDSRLKKTGAGSRPEKTGAGSRPEKTGVGSRPEKTGAGRKQEGLESSLQDCSNLNSNLKISNKIGNKTDISQYNNIVQAVIRYNNSFSEPSGANNGIQNEMNKILERLKDMIKSLIEILDKYEI